MLWLWIAFSSLIWIDSEAIPGQVQIPFVQSESPPAIRKNIASVVLIGSGRMGHIRAKAIHASNRLKLAGIIDTDRDGAQVLGNLYDVPTFESLEEFMQEIYRKREEGIGIDFISGCVICTPTSTHGFLIEQAAQNHLSVFVEKPVAEDVDELNRLFDVCENAGVHLCCGFQRRFDPSYVAAAQAVRTGQVGTPVYAHLFFADHPVPSRAYLLTSGNIFLDLLTHDVDYILDVLNNDTITTVYAIAKSSDAELKAAGVHDSAAVLLTTHTGVTITLFLSRHATYGYDQRCEIFGTKGLVRVDNHYETPTVLSNCTGLHQSKLQHSFPQRFEAAFAMEMECFARVLLLQGGEKSATTAFTWPVSRPQCVQVQRVAEAAQRSQKHRKLVVIMNHLHETREGADLNAFQKDSAHLPPNE